MKNKMNDPTIKEDMRKFKDNVANKSKEISEKGVHMAKKGYESFKKVAWLKIKKNHYAKIREF